MIHAVQGSQGSCWRASISFTKSSPIRWRENGQVRDVKQDGVQKAASSKLWESRVW